ncbi:MAG: Flp pilus assembly protein CpaB [Pseudomonadota bacterium]
MSVPVRIALLGFAFVCGVGVFFLVMTNRPEVAAPVQIVEPVQEKTVRVLVADKDFLRGERLTVETLKWITWPEKALSESFITEDTGANLEDLAGAVARTLIIAGEPIIEQKIVRTGSSSLLAAVIEPGMRAVTMRVSPETASGGFILPGDRVDIFYTEPDDDGVTQIFDLLENVKVLAINTIYSENPETPHIEGSNATLELSPADAELFLTTRDSKGTMSLALRSVFEPDEPIATKRRNDNVVLIKYGRS